MIMAMCCAHIDNANAVARVSVRGQTATGRKSIAATTNVVQPKVVQEEVKEIEEEQEFIISNKSDDFEKAITSVLGSAGEDNSFAEQIRKQRAALAASEANDLAKSAQKKALANNSNSCDSALRKCMQTKCGNGFTKCALDGDTVFGDKLNACRRDTSCTSEEFNLFVTEIKADRDLNVRLGSYDDVIFCGNQYNACILNECGTTYNKCLGKAQADAAIEKCATIEKECKEADSGLSARFGTAIGKLRESAEKDVKKDEERMYKLRDLMSESCTNLGAMFDERTFDCVYTVNFFAGENQQNPTASRKRYAGDTFVCMQEWFGINATTFKENAYRETRAQTAASSAMLGSGVGTATGLIASGAINRALDTQKAKKELKTECESQEGMTFKNGECVKDDTTTKDTKTHKDGAVCTAKNATMAKYQNNVCKVETCLVGYKKNSDETECIKKTAEDKDNERAEKHPQGTPCSTVVGRGEGQYDDKGKCELTKCNAVNYVINPKNNHECILDPNTNINQKVENSNKAIADSAAKTKTKIQESVAKTNEKVTTSVHNTKDKLEKSLENTKTKLENDKNLQLKGMACTTRIKGAAYAVWEDNEGKKCKLVSCDPLKYTKSEDGTSCVLKADKLAPGGNNNK